MAYDGKLLYRAKVQFDADKQRRLEQFLQRQEAIYRRQPRLRIIEKELAHTMGRIISGALRAGTNPTPAIRVLRDENLSLQEERRDLLIEMGLATDVLEEKPACPLCGDTGYRDASVCRCLRAYYTRVQKEELSTMLDLGNQSFDTFSLDWYDQKIDTNYGVSPYNNMEYIYDVCANFAHNFHRKGGNLLLTGAPGLGKTFLSAAMAREVNEGGHSVVYDTAVHIFEQFESQKFNRDQDAGDVEDAVHRILHCDLLILDDLGTEMVTTFVQSAFYQIINTRLVTGKSTIVSSNLSPDQIARRYSPQIASRLQGEYQILPFFGKDIRLLKKG
ncbi:ATP-binding protein [Bengtsoniella intestinalis]|uniref:ATP-binding protein n=1 Tax=Bengtsoniella intestinalis TaxID=3073143 RepID=UPI00391F98FF